MEGIYDTDTASFCYQILYIHTLCKLLITCLAIIIVRERCLLGNTNYIALTPSKVSVALYCKVVDDCYKTFLRTCFFYSVDIITFVGQEVARSFPHAIAVVRENRVSAVLCSAVTIHLYSFGMCCK